MHEEHGDKVTPLYAAPQPAGKAYAVGGCGEEDIAIALFEARHHGMSNILPWDDIEHDGRDYWRAVARGLMRTHRVSSLSSTDRSAK